MRVLVVRAAAAFAANPFLWLQVLGREREELLAGVRAQLANRAESGAGGPARRSGAGAGAAPVGPMLDPRRFLATDTDPAGIPVRPEEAAVPDALLRVLGPLPLAPELNRTRRYAIAEVTRWGRTFRVHQPVEETAEQVLTRFYQTVSAGAARLARGERSPAYRDEPLPGTRVPPRSRVAGEIAALVDERGTCVSLDELTRACPTAAALPPEAAVQAVRGAAERLPAGYVVLADRYVGRRDQIVAGAAFRHVVTWPEWQAGRLSTEGEWFLALTLLGAWPPVTAEMDGRAVALQQWVRENPSDPDPFVAWLKPEVGDELTFAVVEPEPLRLRVTLRRRAERDLLEPLAIDQAAARLLAMWIAGNPYEGIAEPTAVQLLLAEGFYRPGRVPDPVWLLPMPAVGEPVRWGWDRRLVSSYWGRSSLIPGGQVPGWREGHRITAGLGDYLAGLPLPERRAASVFAEAWAERWPGNPLDPDRPPPYGAFLHFLLNRAPVIARQLNLAAEEALRALQLGFRYLVRAEPAMAGAYEPFIRACEAAEPFRHRLATLPALRTPEFQAWEMEGFRWLGPALSLE
ncbi:MAG: hypothetical protein CWE10_10350 [Symbiobacterium thermophilum]|uniref:Uncharacterized protein n=1 Tax=Symbiobacterium thermophilum TaxID=2734 RepID=A0A953I303_SYMTR|nr:hypothetical protein [Symbiobacterium thermophilum]